MKNIFGAFAVILLISCAGKDEKANTADVPQAALVQSVNSEAFNQSFETLLNHYYTLKDQFIAEKDSQIVVSARNLMLASDSLRLDEMKADSNIVATARSYSSSISAELKGLLGEKDIEEQRKSFQMVSDQLYDLVRTVQYDRAVVYHEFCPMAFNDKGAHWLSNSSEIRNPYLPKKMLICGEVKDSLDFRKQ